jgi:hypothetical protein
LNVSQSHVLVCYREKINTTTVINHGDHTCKKLIKACVYEFTHAGHQRQ